MSFDKNGYYVGKHESKLTTISNYYVSSAYVPCGYKIFYNEIIQEGDLYYSIAKRSWSLFHMKDLGVMTDFLARKTKTVNQIFIDM